MNATNVLYIYCIASIINNMLSNKDNSLIIITPTFILFSFFKKKDAFSLHALLMWCINKMKMQCYVAYFLRSRLFITVPDVSIIPVPA